MPALNNRQVLDRRSQAIRGSLAVLAGRIAAMPGPNRAGRTMLKAVPGQFRQGDGEIIAGGIRPEGDSAVRVLAGFERH